MSKKKQPLSARIRESVRKMLVSLKRKPSNIALFVLVIGFLQYSLQLTVISNTTAKIQGTGMGLFGFITMLLSILGIVCFGNAFPHRKPVNKPMLALMFAMFAAVIFADLRYIAIVNNAITRELNPIAVTAATQYIPESVSVLRVNVVIYALGLLLTALLPAYSPLIKKINTSISVADNGNIAAIELSGEDA